MTHEHVQIYHALCYPEFCDALTVHGPVGKIHHSHPQVGRCPLVLSSSLPGGLSTGPEALQSLDPCLCYTMRP